MTLWYLFDSTIREISNINIFLRYLLMEVIGKKHGEKKALFNYFNRF